MVVNLNGNLEKLVRLAKVGAALPGERKRKQVIKTFWQLKGASRDGQQLLPPLGGRLELAEQTYGIISMLQGVKEIIRLSRGVVDVSVHVTRRSAGTVWIGEGNGASPIRHGVHR